MKPAPDHKAALDGLREGMLEEVGALWKHRVLWRSPRDVARCSTVLATNAQLLRETIDRIRALDAVRRAANDAEVQLRLWQKRAERAALPIIAGGSGRW